MVDGEHAIGEAMPRPIRRASTGRESQGEDYEEQPRGHLEAVLELLPCGDGRGRAEARILRIALVNPYFSGILALLATGLLPNAFSMMSAARSSVPPTKCPYTPSVIVGEL